MLVLLLAACDPPGAAPDAVYYADVKPILDARCGGCHVSGGIGPFPLGTYDEAAPLAAAIEAAVVSGSMPPWPVSDTCNVYDGDRSLTDAQIATLSAWAEAGAPEGDPSEEGAALPPSDGLSRVDVTAEMPEAFTPTEAPDEYRCFLLDWTPEEDAYITGFGAIPGNDAIVHHVVAFHTDAADVATYTALDAESATPGWPCNGGPGGDVTTGASWLGAWAPGGTGADFAEGTGIPVAPGDRIVLQLHYNLATAEPAPDLSAVTLRLDPEVEKPARVVKLLDPTWPVGDNLLIPAGSEDVTYTWSLPNTFGADVLVYSAAVHMHQLGTSGSLTIDHATEPDTCVVDFPEYDFHWQGSYQLAAPTVFGDGDTATLTCTYANPGTEDVTWGEGTADEMCLGVVYVTL